MPARKRRLARINGWPIDLVKSEEIGMASKITDHPTEKGQDLTDNIRRMPMTISMECLVSDSPIGEIATDPTRQLDIIEIESNFVATGDILSDTISGIADNVNVVRNALVPLPSEDAHQRLMQWWMDELPVEVECSKGVFKNCGIESISEIADASTGGGLSFNVKFKVLRILDNKEVRTSTQMPTKKPKDFGLSLDKLVEGKTILWRKGKPPGLSPATDPKGVIVGTEIVHIINGKYLHEDKKKELTTKELRDFAADLNRDSSLLERRGIAKAEAIVDRAGAKLEKAEKMLEYQKKNPGRVVDKAAFGL